MTRRCKLLKTSALLVWNVIDLSEIQRRSPFDVSGFVRNPRSNWCGLCLADELAGCQGRNSQCLVTAA